MKDENKGFEENITKLKNNDEQFREQLSQLTLDLSKALQVENLDIFFNLLKDAYSRLVPYEYMHKEIFNQYITAIKDVRKELPNKILTRGQQLQFGQKRFELQELLEMLYHIYFRALDELGLYMKVLKTNSDFEEQISQECFNNPDSLILQEIEELKALTAEQLLKLFNTNHIHIAHSRLVIQGLY